MYGLPDTAGPVPAGSSTQTSFAPGTRNQSKENEAPSQILLYEPLPPPPPPSHFPSLHEPLSHSSPDSQSSPPLFFGALHLPSVHDTLAHSSSFSQSSPPPFLSSHL